MFLKQSTSVTIVLGPFVDSTDGATAETALTISQADVRLSKNAGTFAQKNDANAAAHMENGHYSVALNATDTNTPGRLRVAVTESGALPVWRDFVVLPGNVYDSLVAGSDELAVDAGAIADAVWDEALSAHSTAGSTGEALNDAAGNVPPSAAAVADAVWDEALSGHLTAGSTGEALSDAGAAGAPPTAGEIADAVWDEALAAHLTAGSTGDALQDAGGATADPWAAELPGSYAGGTAGWIVGTRLDAQVSAVSGGSAGQGAVEWTYTLLDAATGDPIGDADVWVTTDAAGGNVVAGGRTDQFGTVTFYLDSGTVYVWRQKSGWNFVNPDVEVVA